MKKITSLISIMTVVALLMVMQGCSKDEIKPAPSITVDPISASNTPGNIVTTKLTFSAPNGARDLLVYVAGIEVDSKTLAGVSSPMDYEYTVPTTAIIGSTIVVSFQLMDSKNYPSPIANFVVTVGDPIITLQGTLITQTLDATKPYLLKGQVFIPSGATLTIPEGTVIKGDKATKAVLIIQPGGTLLANGTPAKPIVFTSSQAVGTRDRGDWGGIILLGNAWVNQAALPAIEGITPSQTYGNITSPTTNAGHSAGSMKYVRIEYAGVELTPNNETNGLTLGGVGNGTVLDFIQSSFGGDDAIEWFGGTVNAKHLVAFSAWDDDFDTDFGWSGNVQWALSVRNPFSADQSGSTSFESDNQGNANDTNLGSIGYTQGVFSNVTTLGPRDFTQGLSANPRAISGNYTRAMHIRRRTAISIFNTVISGWGSASIPGLTMDDQATLDNFTAGLGVLSNNVLFHTDAGTNTEFGSNIAGAAATTVATFWANGANTTVKPSASVAWSPTPGTPANSIDPYPAYGIDKALFFAAYTTPTYPSNPNFAVTSGNLTGQSAGTLFASAKLGAFFDKTLTYKGAFGNTDWTDGWSEFQPLNKVY